MGYLSVGHGRRVVSATPGHLLSIRPSIPVRHRERCDSGRHKYPATTVIDGLGIQCPKAAAKPRRTRTHCRNRSTRHNGSPLSGSPSSERSSAGEHRPASSRRRTCCGTRWWASVPTRSTHAAYVTVALEHGLGPTSLGTAFDFRFGVPIPLRSAPDGFGGHAPPPFRGPPADQTRGLSPTRRFKTPPPQHGLEVHSVKFSRWATAIVSAIVDTAASSGFFP